MRTVELETINETLIEKICDRIVSAYRPVAVYLFGSAARKEAVAGSDLDLLVVMELPKNTQAHEIAGQIRRLFDGWLVPLDILVETPRAFARNKQVPGHIDYRASTEGRLLYTRIQDA